MSSWKQSAALFASISFVSLYFLIDRSQDNASASLQDASPLHSSRLMHFSRSQRTNYSGYDFPIDLVKHACLLYHLVGEVPALEVQSHRHDDVQSLLISELWHDHCTVVDDPCAIFLVDQRIPREFRSPKRDIPKSHRLSDSPCSRRVAQWALDDMKSQIARLRNWTGSSIGREWNEAVWGRLSEDVRSRALALCGNSTSEATHFCWLFSVPVSMIISARLG